MKKCSKCSQDKPLDEFHRRAGSKDGRRAACKECMQVYFADPQNREIAKNRAKDWHHSNGDRAKATKLKYRAENPEILKERDRVWRLANPDKKRASARNWQRNNPDKVAAISHKRRAMIRGQSEHFTAQEWLDLCGFYDNTCLACGRNDVSMTVDHIVPIAVGGANSIENIQPLCKLCNCKKGTQIIDYRLVHHD